MLHRLHRGGPLFIVVALLGGPACTFERDPMLDPRDAGTDGFVAPDAAPLDGGLTCEPGAAGCAGFVRYVCGDDGASRTEETVCEGSCDEALGCIPCLPGAFRCDGDVSLRCSEEHRWMRLRDCEEWGVACGAVGVCDDECGAAEAVRSNVGCEYWPVPLANSGIDRNAYDFRVVVANPGRRAATVTITRGGRFVARAMVQPGGLAEIVLPWVDGVSFPFAVDEWESIVTADGAYRLVSSRPVIVSQFNPFHYASAVADFSFSNDASLLLPTHVLGRDHVGTSYVPFSVSDDWDPTDEFIETARYPGYLAVVGVSTEPTRVEIRVAGNVAADASGRWVAVAAGGTITFTLARGEVAQVAAAVPPTCGRDRPGFRDLDPEEPHVLGYCRETDFDLTGSRITSEHPVSVFGGHACTNVPYDVVACDHLETQLAPVETWGRRYQTMPLRDPTTDIPNLLRITAAHDATTVTLTPPPRESSATHELDAGEYVEVVITGATDIVGSAPIQVAQLLVGQNITDPPLRRGDPGMTTLVPEEQFRPDYVFVTPTSYTPLVLGQSFLLISRASGTSITLDGAALDDATWTGAGARELAIVPVPGGAHTLVATAPVGVIAYGLGQYTSYAYPAGLDLRVIPF